MTTFADQRTASSAHRVGRKYERTTTVAPALRSLSSALQVECLTASTLGHNRKAVEQVFKADDYRHYAFVEQHISGCLRRGHHIPRTTPNAPPNLPVAEKWLAGTKDNWFDPSVPAEEQALLLKAILPAGEFGGVQLTSTIAKSVDLETTFPGIANVLALKAGLGYKPTARASVSEASASNRRMRWPGFPNAVSK